jgi:hypothetical protein
VIEKEQLNILGKSFLDVLKFPTINANNAVLEPTVDLPLPQNDRSALACDKELCDSAFIIHIPQLVNDIDSFVLDQNTCAENKQMLPIATEQDELKLLSSLNILGYIEFHTVCALSSLEEKFKYVGLPWLFRCTYHFIGNYNCKGE